MRESCNHILEANGKCQFCGFERSSNLVIVGGRAGTEQVRY